MSTPNEREGLAESVAYLNEHVMGYASEMAWHVNTVINALARRKRVEAQLEVYREALYVIQNEPSCSPVVHELAGNALAGEKP